MKRFLGIIAVAAAVIASVSSCHKVVRDVTKGVVDEINDSVMIAKVDDAKVKFDISEAAFTNGVVMYGDSVNIHYIGDLSMKRCVAEQVVLIVRPSQVVIIDENAPIDTTKVLQTKEAEPTEAAEAKRNAAYARQFIKK